MSEKHEDDTENSAAEEAAATEDVSAEEESPSLEDVSLQDQLDAAIAERDEAKDQILRTYAELENTRRRARKDAEDLR